MLQSLQQQAVGTAVTAKAVRKLPVEIARRQPYPVQSVRSLLGRTEAGRQIDPRLHDLALPGRQFSFGGRTFAACPRLYAVRLYGDQQRRANEEPGQVVTVGQCGIGNCSRELANQRKWRLRIGRIGVPGQNANPRICSVGSRANGSLNLPLRQLREQMGPDPRRRKNGLPGGPLHLFLKLGNRHKLQIPSVFALRKTICPIRFR